MWFTWGSLMFFLKCLVYLDWARRLVYLQARVRPLKKSNKDNFTCKYMIYIYIDILICVSFFLPASSN